MADQTFQNVINGELVGSVSGETYDIVDPTTGEVYAQAPMSGAEDVDRAYAAAAAAFESWGETTPQDRGNALLKIAQANSTTVKDIKALNGLTTDRIKVGDKLKLPAKSSAGTSNSTATNLGAPSGTSNL